MIRYDLLVIGAGPGGTPAAMAAAQFGKKVLLVDKRGEPGGECLFEGCIPSKIFENAANRYELFKNAAEFHVTLKNTPQIHWEEVLKEKERVLRLRSRAAMKRFETLSTLDFKKGRAKFIDSNTVDVDGDLYSFEKAVIATGAHAHLPPLPGNALTKVWTNEDVFNSKVLPKEIAFIGAGAVSCELVQMFSKLGVKCHILERGPRILKRVDEEAALLVQKRMVEQGIDVVLNVDFESLDWENGGFVVKFEQNGQKREIDVPHLLVAAGRAANVEDLGLDKIGVEYDRHGIEVDETLRTTLPHIYASGDCAKGPKFAHWATYEAGVAIHNLFATSKRKIDYGKLSWVLFSDPQVALAGLNEADAIEHGMKVDVERYDYRMDARAQIDHDTDGFVKFVIDRESGAIVGVQIVSRDASTLAGEAALIVSLKLKPIDVMSAIHPHPTLNEAFGNLAREFFFKSMMSKSRK